MRITINMKYDRPRHYDDITAVRYKDIGVGSRLVLEQGARIITIGLSLIDRVELVQGDKS